MNETLFYTAKVQLFFDNDPIEQILLETEQYINFNSLDSWFEISGWVDTATNKIYFNVDKISFACIDDLMRGAGIATIESSFPLTEFTMRMISRYICAHNDAFWLVDSDSRPISINFTDFMIKECI